MKRHNPDDVIVTYGEEWTVGKELLCRALLKFRPGCIRGCIICMGMFEPRSDTWWCDHCAALTDEERLNNTIIK